MNHSENTHNSLPPFHRSSPFLNASPFPSLPSLPQPLAHLIFSTQPRINFSRAASNFISVYPFLKLFFFSLCLLNSRKMPRKSLSSLAHIASPSTPRPPSIVIFAKKNAFARTNGIPFSVASVNTEGINERSPRI